MVLLGRQLNISPKDKRSLLTDHERMAAVPRQKNSQEYLYMDICILILYVMFLRKLVMCWKIFIDNKCCI